jgi:phosphopantothenoylcysteine synthetase/decarboxylase
LKNYLNGRRMMQPQKRKKIIVGITASIAAYKTCELIRKYVKAGYNVYTIITANATQLVSPLTLETLSGNPVYSDSFVREQHKMGHISLRENASLFAVVPATANCLGKFAHGIADDLLSTTFLSVTCPVLIAPAMNPVMWQHALVQQNVRALRDLGVHFVDPAVGEVICGDEGAGKLASLEDIYHASVRLIGS